MENINKFMDQKDPTKKLDLSSISLEDQYTKLTSEEKLLIAAKGLDEETVKAGIQNFIDSYNKNQPTYRQIVGLVIRKNPFIRSSTKKIKRQEALIDEPIA